MRSIKHITKFAAALVVAAVAFGPFGVLQETPTVHAASCDASTPGARYISNGVDGGGYYSCPDGTTTNGVSGKSRQGPADTSCSGITSCMASLVYYIGPGFASWVAGIVAYFFDFIVRLSLNSTAYALGFLTVAWALALNLANMAFIFILLGIAYTIMLKAETARTMQTLAWVIAIALVVNFSFFATRIVIDAGNILATQFYNAILTQPGVTPGTATTPPDLTAPLMNALGVDSLIGPGAFAQAQAMFPDGSGFGTLLVLTVVFIATAVMLWMIAISLLMVGIKFFVRVVGLWLVLIISPVAFVTRVSPRTQRVFDLWLKTLVGFSFYPAVFLFMFYILNLFVKDVAGGNLLQSAFGQGNGAQGAAAGTSGASASLIANIANISIRMGFIIVMLYIMLKVADWVMEQSGGLAMNIMNRTSGVLVGGTARLGAFAGRNTVGRAAGRAAESSTLKGKTGIMGNALWRGASALSRSTFDIRNGPAGRTAARGASLLANVNVGKPSDRSFAASVDARAKEVEKRAEALKATPVEVRNLQEAVNREKAGRITELNKELEQARATGNTQKENQAMADLKAIQNGGKTQAKALEKERITQLAQRIGGRNVGNLGMPSMGSIKGAAAAMAIAEGKKKEKESSSTSATSSTSTPTPTPTAPAVAMAAPASHGDDKMLTELKLIRKTLDRMRKQTAESNAHTAEALHSSTAASANVGAAIIHAVDDLKKAANDNPEPSGGTTPPSAAGEWREVQEGEVLPAGVQVEMDMTTGKKRWRKVA